RAPAKPIERVPPRRRTVTGIRKDKIALREHHEPAEWLISDLHVEARGSRRDRAKLAQKPHRAELRFEHDAFLAGRRGGQFEGAWGPVAGLAGTWCQGVRKGGSVVRRELGLGIRRSSGAHRDG